MAKGASSSRKKEHRNPNSRHKSNGYKHDKPVTHDFVDDEIDAFHKQRDFVPLDVDDDMKGSDEDDVLPVFDIKNGDDEDEEDDEDDEDEDDDEEDEDDTQVTALAAKLQRTQKNLLAKSGGVDDEMHDDTVDEESSKKIWGRTKGPYYGADNADYEELQSSDEDLNLEQEDALKLEKEKAGRLSEADFGLDDISQDESDGEPTLEEIRSKEKAPSELGVHNDLGVAYEVVKKDLNALTKEEQMAVVYNSAPELVNLLSELHDAVSELENKIDPLLSKVKNMGNKAKEGLHYLETKQLLLLAYCQAITFYLLLKSEGQSVRDHPVIGRLVEIKNLLGKMKKLDENLPSGLEDILMKQQQIESIMKLPKDDVILTSASTMNEHTVSNGKLEVAASQEAAQEVRVDSSKNNEKKRRKLKDTDEHVGLQSKEMLKVRVALEEKLKQTELFSSITSKHDKVHRHQQILNGQLATLADFDDDVSNKSKGNTTQHSSKPSQLVTPLLKNPKTISGDDDLPRRDDIGERRRKHELRVLAGAGIKSTDDDNGDELENFLSDEDIDMVDGDEPGSEDDFYKQVKQQRAAKLAAKAELYSTTPAIPSVLEETQEETLEDGKRHISNFMEKNRGLTRPRKKEIKNPRKKYKLKHKKAVVARKGQVRDMRKHTGPYGGETSGINAGISRSIRL